MKTVAELVGEWDAIARANGDDVQSSVLKPGATDEQIAILEDRLGVVLPESYRQFLQASNGADVLPGGSFYRFGPDGEPTALRSAETLDWARRADPDLVDIWTSSAYDALPDHRGNPEFLSGLDERMYLDYDAQDCVYLKRGHLRYALSISHCIDGYEVFLNPLVVDADGEWEAWDFGTKLPGADRFPSFRALLADANKKAWGYAGGGGGAPADTQVSAGSGAELAVVEGLIADALDKGQRASETYGPLKRRSDAIYGLTRYVAVAGVREALWTVVDDETDEEWIRQAAANVLIQATPKDQRPTEFLRLSHSPVLRLRAAILPDLAASSDPEAHEAALAILTDPQTEWWVYRSVRADGADTVWEGWQRSHATELLVASAMVFDQRCIEPMAGIIAAGDVSEAGYAEIVQAAWRFRDPRITAALIAASRRDAAPLLQIGQTLHTLGAVDEAIKVLERVDTDRFSRQAAESLIAQSRTPRAGELLLESVRTRPSAISVRGLGSYPSPESVAALVPLLTSELRDEVIGTLEVIATPDAVDALSSESANGDMLATRALARLRDRRALRPLVEALESADPSVALEGADGLRDLRDGASTERLLGAAGHDDPDVAVTAVHALVCMQSPHMTEALSKLASHADPQARKLAERWLETARKG